MGIRASFVVGVVLAGLSCATYAAEKVLDRTFTVQPGGTLRVMADSSDIVVTGTDSSQVVVHILATGSQRTIQHLTLTADQSGNDVEVGARHQSDGWMSWLWQNWRLDSRVTVQIPRTYNVDVKTSGGDLTITRATGTVRGKTSGGDIRAGQIEGPLDVGTSGGDVEIDGVKGDTTLRTSGGDVVATAIQGKLDAKTSGGNVHLSRIEGPTRARTSSGDVIASDMKGEVDLHSSGGNIKAFVTDGRINAETSGGDIKAELTGANQGISATSSGGSIELRLPKGTTGQLDASTSGGSISTGLPVTTTEMGERKLKGSINGGGEAIYARTSGGDIRLHVKD